MPRSWQRAIVVCFLASALLSSIPLPAAVAAEPALVAIIIDDLGNSLIQGRQVIRLPAPVALAILPHTAFGTRLATEAHRARKEILLHLPMQPLGAADAGPGRIDADMPARELVFTLDYDLTTVPHAIGVNNHMGSRTTQDERTMRTLLEALRTRGHLFYVDSLTSERSAAAAIGRAIGLPTLTRDVFIDHEPTPTAIRRQLNQLAARARTQGYAIGIGHPYPETLAQLAAWLPLAPRQNVRVVGLSEVLERTNRKPNHGERAATVGAGF